jgi:hypothetical protein
VEGPTDEVEVDYGEPGRVAYVPPGHNLSQLSPPGMDISLATIADRVGEQIGKSTVPRVLQTGDFPAGTAFASLNLATQSGIKSLTPYKELAEEALADVMMQMLYWVDHTGEPLKAFSPGRKGAGDQFTLLPDSARVEDIAVEVELTADVPTDRMARINAASMAVRELGYSRARALEQIGESDPDMIVEEAREEELARVDLEIEKQKRMVMGQMSLKKMKDETGDGEKSQEELEREAFIAEVMKNPTARERMLGILRGKIELESQKRKRLAKEAREEAKKPAFKTVGLTHEEKTGEAKKHPSQE